MTPCIASLHYTTANLRCSTRSVLCRDSMYQVSPRSPCRETSPSAIETNPLRVCVILKIKSKLSLSINRLHPYTFRRFSEAFLNSSTSDGAVPVTLWAHRGLLFVILNSMALEGDGCRFCQRAEDALQSVAKKLQCLRGELALESCLGDFDLVMEPGSDRKSSLSNS